MLTLFDIEQHSTGYNIWKNNKDGGWRYLNSGCISVYHRFSGERRGCGGREILLVYSWG
jgi:hypothetical protein